MADPNEIAALKASFKGVMATADALGAVRERLDALGASGEVDPATLEDLRRLSAAHAAASQALRGLVETMIRRREAG